MKNNFRYNKALQWAGIVLIFVLAGYGIGALASKYGVLKTGSALAETAAENSNSGSAGTGSGQAQAGTAAQPALPGGSNPLLQLLMRGMPGNLGGGAMGGLGNSSASMSQLLSNLCSNYQAPSSGTTSPSSAAQLPGANTPSANNPYSSMFPFLGMMGGQSPFGSLGNGMLPLR